MSYLLYFLSDVLTDVEAAADLLEDNLRDQIGPFQPRDIETVKKLTGESLYAILFILRFIESANLCRLICTF